MTDPHDPHRETPEPSVPETVRGWYERFGVGRSSPEAEELRRKSEQVLIWIHEDGWDSVTRHAWNAGWDVETLERCVRYCEARGWITKDPKKAAE